jgi:hypothetical protein
MGKLQTVGYGDIRQTARGRRRIRISVVGRRLGELSNLISEAIARNENVSFDIWKNEVEERTDGQGRPWKTKPYSMTFSTWESQDGYAPRQTPQKPAATETTDYDPTSEDLPF